MVIDERLTWGGLFQLLDLTPGIEAKPTRLESCAQILTELKGQPRTSSVDERMTLMAGLLAPFFCPLISWMDAFEIARAGESSPLIFKVFQERTEIGVVLHLCKALKAAPVLQLAHDGPKRIAELAVSLIVGAASSDVDSGDIGANLVSFFSQGAAGRSAVQVQAYLADPKNMPMPEVDLFALATAFPGWALISRDAHPLLWAARHDETALILKNAPLPGLESRQRKAVEMMESAIKEFEQQGASQDAAIAKSNLANLIARVDWLTLDERFQQATALYDSAIQSATDREFRALLMDNIAGRLAEAANFGFEGSRRKALEMSLAAARELEAIGNTDRLPAVLGNVVFHLQGLRDETDNRKEDLERARELARRALSMLQNPGGSVDTKTLIVRLKQTLADLLVRSVQFEPERKTVFAAEAIELLDSIDA